MAPVRRQDDPAKQQYEMPNGSEFDSGTLSNCAAVLLPPSRHDQD
jgi:hypothetical protein